MEIERRAPIFVTGYMRSGTTLLGNVIDRHSSIAVFIESFFIPRYYFTQVLFWPLSRSRNFLRLAQSIVNEASSKRNGMGLDEARVLSAAERNLPSLIDSLFSEWAQSRGKHRWADKSPGYISKIATLDRMFGDARFVHIIRDGRDVWLSLKRLGWKSDVVEVANDWANTVARARQYGATMSPDRYLEVSYERLVEFPEHEVRRIAAFLGEPYEPAMIQPDEEGPGNPALAGWPKVDLAIDAHNTKKWKDRLGSYELAVFDLCAKDLLESFGYETPVIQHSLEEIIATRLRQARAKLRRPMEVMRRAVRLFAKAASDRWTTTAT